MTNLCPICRKAPVTPAFRPFCSRRCADVDLQGWLSGRYAIAAQEEDQPEADALDRGGDDTA
jgi:endogenous inhibitor of DNA gyrase (YacG/DUF329 family)